jgi:hypothetical protein
MAMGAGWHQSAVAQTIVGPRWAPITVSSPPTARFEHAAIYDPLRQRMLIFAGEDATESPRNDVWALSLTGTPTWTQLSTTGGPPTPRADLTAIYDPIRDRMLVYGGEASGEGARYSDLWALSLADNSWTMLAPAGPCSRSGYMAVYDPDADAILVYGGRDDPSVIIDEYQDTDEFPFSTGLWRQASYGGTPCSSPGNPPPLVINPCRCACDNGSGGCSGQPTRREYAATIWDPVRHQMVMEGGWYRPTPQTFGEIWTYAGPGHTVWQNLNIDSPQLQNHRAIYDPVRDRMVIFGGSVVDALTGDSGPFNDTHTFSFTTQSWTLHLSHSGTAPTPREYASAIYDPVGDRMIVFAGAGDLAHTQLFDDSYELDFDTTPPAAVTDLGVSINCTSIDLTWTAPGDDGTTGTATSYDLRRSRSQIITDQDFSSASTLGAPHPDPAGTQEHVNIATGACSGRWYFALKTYDEVGNGSALSNVPFGQTPCRNCNGGSAAKRVDLPLSLSAPLPNPATAEVGIRFSIPNDRAREPIALAVFDPAGRRVRTLQQGPSEGGAVALTWDLSGDDGRRVGPGFYFLRLKVGSDVRTRTLMILR